MIRDQLGQEPSSKKVALELLESIFYDHNLAKTQILSQSIPQLRQSIVTINSFIADLNSDFSYINSQSDNLFKDFDNSYILLSLIQRKTIIINRYKKVMKKEIIKKIKFSIETLDDGIAKDKLKLLINKLEYIENNSHNITGQLQNLIS
jgi:hypothetical protein